MSDGPDPNPVNASLPWGTDFRLTANGSIAFVSGDERLKERIIRRAFSNPEETLQDGTFVPADYIFDKKYGLGASRAVGQVNKPSFLSTMEARIRKAIMVDEGVDTSKPPVIRFFQQGSAFFAKVRVFTIDGGQVDIVFPFK